MLRVARRLPTLARGVGRASAAPTAARLGGALWRGNTSVFARRLTGGMASAVVRGCARHGGASTAAHSLKLGLGMATALGGAAAAVAFGASPDAILCEAAAAEPEPEPEAVEAKAAVAVADDEDKGDTTVTAAALVLEETRGPAVWTRMLKLMKDDWLLFLAAGLASVAAAVAGVSAAAAIGTTFDALSRGAEIGAALRQLCGLYLGKASLAFISNSLLSMGINRMSARLQASVFCAVLQQDLAFFGEAAQTNELIRQITEDTREACAALKHLFQNGLRAAAGLLGGAHALYTLSPSLSVVTLTLLPLGGVAFDRFGHFVRGYSRESQRAEVRASFLVGESISNVRTVQAFCGEDAEAARFGDEVEAALSLRHQLGMWRSLFFEGIGLALSGVTAVIVAVGGRLVKSGDMTHGDVNAFRAVAMRTVECVGALMRLLGELTEGTHAARRVFALLDAQPAIRRGEGVVPDEVVAAVTPAGAGGSARALEMRGLSFAYPSRPEQLVLKDLNLRLEEGSVTALVGESGSGKSTVAWLLERFYDPTHGEVLWFDGTPLDQLDPAWLRQRVGLVSQEPTLFAATIEENIRYGRPDATAAEVRQAAKDANALEFIAQLPEGLATRLASGGGGLSGGQKQRIAIARAILRDPSILLLDEATSALDAHSESVVQEALQRLMAGRTVVLIAHRLSTVRNADKIVVLNRGVVVDEGQHDALVAAGGPYAALIQLQQAAQKKQQL